MHRHPCLLRAAVWSCSYQVGDSKCPTTTGLVPAILWRVHVPPTRVCTHASQEMSGGPNPALPCKNPSCDQNDVMCRCVQSRHASGRLSLSRTRLISRWTRRTFRLSLLDENIQGKRFFFEKTKKRKREIQYRVLKRKALPNVSIQCGSIE